MEVADWFACHLSWGARILQAADFMSCEAWQRHPCVELEISLALFPGPPMTPIGWPTGRIVGALYDEVDCKMPHVKACCSSSLASLNRPLRTGEKGLMPRQGRCRHWQKFSATPSAISAPRNGAPAPSRNDGSWWRSIRCLQCPGGLSAVSRPEPPPVCSCAFTSAAYLQAAGFVWSTAPPVFRLLRSCRPVHEYHGTTPPARPVS